MVESPQKVSIVLPTFNGTRYIRQSIDSCLNQTYKNIELIIVDDGSTDEIPEIIMSYKDDRIKYFRHEKNRGLPQALNTGFAKATGEYLTWTSDDNQYLPEAIERMLDCLKKNNIDFVYADYWAYYPESGKKEFRKLPDKLDLKIENSIGACFLYTYRVYQNIGNYNPKYELVEDYDYWIRISEKFNYIHYPHPLYIYYEHSKSLKSTKYQRIVLFDRILKYQNGYISLSKLIDSIFQFYLYTIKFHKEKKEAIIIYFQNIYKLSQLSAFLGGLSTLVLIYFSLSMIAKKIVKFIKMCLEYIYYILSFKKIFSRLKTNKNKKNVLCIIPYFVMGGAERVILNIAKGTDMEKFSFHIITTIPADNVWLNKVHPYFQNVIIPVKRVAIEKILYKYFRELIIKLNIDIIITHNSSIGYKYLPQLKSEFIYVKTIDILHAEESIGASDGFEWVAPYIDKRICISDHLKNYMIKKYNNSGIEDGYIERLKVIRNGIDIREYNPNVLMKNKFKTKYGIPDDAKIISFIGRFSIEKDPLLFVNIAKNIIARLHNYEIRFVMAGDGYQFDEVRDTIKKFGIEDCFVLTGMIDNIIELLADTNILLIVSKNEGIPFVILEAMAMEVPVISSDVGAVNEVIKDNINGYLINPDDNVIESFACKILELLSGNLNHSELGKKAREMVVSEYSLDNMGVKYETIFQELLSFQIETKNRKNLDENNISLKR